MSALHTRWEIKMKLMRTVLFIAVLAGFGLVAAVSTDTVAIGPYVQQVTPTTANIVWWTETGEGAPACYNDPMSKYERHELALTGLAPGSVHDYDVLGTGAPEGTGRFVTFPDSPSPFRFAVLGDTQSNDEVHASIVDQIIEEEPLFLLGTGDAVSEGLELNEWETFFQIRRDLLRNVPFYSALGNHERDSSLYFDFFDLPGNERYYSFTVGDVLFVLLDSEGPIPVDLPVTEKADDSILFYFARQKAWLEQTLQENSDSPFIFVAMHRPMFSVNSERGLETAYNRLRWGDIFERHRVQIVFSGHDHHYHHAYNNGTHYVTTGGGGGHLRDIDDIQPETILTEKVHHHVIVDVEDDIATLNAIDIDKEVIESFNVEAR